MFDWAEQSQDEKYMDWLKKIFKNEYWQAGNRMYNADDISVGQAYL
jgi:rhamnogalacturonyl hydrolase YesR